MPLLAHSAFSPTYDADDEGEQVNDAVEDLDVPLRLITENSVDQDGCRENVQ